MKQKVSDYIADFFVKHQVTDVFTVTGGGAMHLNDSFGHHPGLHCTYQHHEQACAMAAEGYARLSNRMALVCVTTGPGATNAVTGVLGGWMDSIPMFVISGQARYATTVRSTGLKLRSRGVQECDIVPVVSSITKYAEMIVDPNMVRYHLEQAFYLATHGRKGPVWLDIPLDVQGAVIETEELVAWEAPKTQKETPTDALLTEIVERIEKSERPVLFPGNGVRLSGAIEAFRELVSLLGVPVITGMSSVDVLETESPFYVGLSGSTGSRAGNFAMQNSDLLFCMGNRLGFNQTGFQTETWARNAFTIINDIDENELKKPGVHVGLPVCCDVKELIEGLAHKACSRGADPAHPLFKGEEWRQRCRMWRDKYPVVTAKNYETIEEGCTNIYAFYQELTKVLPEQAKLVVSVGTSRVAGSQVFQAKCGQRFITNPNTASMGFGLPAAIGVSQAVRRSGESPQPLVACVTGEGSLQMNLQELQTIRHQNYPLKLFIVNNQGYHSIRQTQQRFFKEPLVGVGEESGDFSFPDLSLLIPAYGFPYTCVHETEKLGETLQQVLATKGPAVCEIFVTKYQMTEPRTAAKKLPDGGMFSAPLEDLYPFLPRAEMEENMVIPMVSEEH